MSNVLAKITARAKLIRKAHPSKKWTDCIKQASREIKAVKVFNKKAAPRKKPAKKKAAKKRLVSYRQTGTSKIKVDRKLVARKPGKRLSVTGKVYYERRKNRSDKPGALSGVSAASLKGALKDRLEEKLGRETVRLYNAKLKRDKNKIQKVITSIKAELRKLK